MEMLSLNYSEDTTKNNELCTNHAGLQHFMTKTSTLALPIFVGLSSIGSMGFLKNPRAFLVVLKAVIEITNYRFILFSAGYQPLEAAIQSLASSSLNPEGKQNFTCHEDSTLLFNERLLCYSGTIPYNWLFPRCAVAIHHGGSGSVAAALHAGIPQIVCPFILDQFYWAERLNWLGVAPEPLQKQHLVPETDDATCIERATDVLSKAIKLALSPEMKAQASNIADRISSEDGIGEALKILKEEVICPIK